MNHELGVLALNEALWWHEMLSLLSPARPSGERVTVPHSGSSRNVRRPAAGRVRRLLGFLAHCCIPVAFQATLSPVLLQAGSVPSRWLARRVACARDRGALSVATL